MNERLTFRDEVLPQDPREVERIVRSTGAFRKDEIEIAVELVAERLARGEASGYHFLFAESAGRTVGYACFGPIPCTLHSYDLYWIAVENELRGRGIGRQLLDESERTVATRGGTRLYVETSSREDYAGTRAFYEAQGYVVEATLTDFYAPGDSKVIFLRVLPAN